MHSDPQILDICRGYSMIGDARMACNLQSIETIEANQIEGDVVEIGVWRGGSILSMILKYETYGRQDRHFYLYDTFSGMTAPSNLDRDNRNRTAALMMSLPSVRCVAPYSVVKSNLDRHTQYPYIHYVPGDICKTKTFPPNKIALLRLDTDWYESTKAELEMFYPLVQTKGIVVIDDYGHWKGCKRAVDEFLARHPEISIQTTDYTGIWFTKPQ